MIYLKKLFFVFVPVLICFVLFFSSFVIKENIGYVNTSASNILPVIIIDAGHGGFDGGASTADGFPEKDINLSISLYLKDYLELFGFKTILTRSSDASLEDDGLTTIRKKKTSDIHNRMKIMSETDNAVFLSIHQNFYPVEKYSGMQVFYSPHLSNESSFLAQCIQDSTVELLQPENDRQIKECGTSVYLIYNAQKPACLVECGFLSNKEEADMLKSGEYQKQVAFCIATGVKKYFYKD